MMNPRFALPIAVCSLMGVLPSTEASAQQKGAPPKTLAGAHAFLQPWIAKSFPNTEIRLDERTLAVKAKTMEFSLHRIARNGQISKETYQSEGPQYDGFVLSIIRSEGRYQGPAVTPQTLQRPYWRTLINEIYDPMTDSHLWIAYSFGSRVDPTFHSAMLNMFGQPGRLAR